jgi:hypothetical protein
MTIRIIAEDGFDGSGKLAPGNWIRNGLGMAQRHPFRDRTEPSCFPQKKLRRRNFAAVCVQISG